MNVLVYEKDELQIPVIAAAKALGLTRIGHKRGTTTSLWGDEKMVLAHEDDGPVTAVVWDETDAELADRVEHILACPWA